MWKQWLEYQYIDLRLGRKKYFKKMFLGPGRERWKADERGNTDLVSNKLPWVVCWVEKWLAVEAECFSIIILFKIHGFA